MSNPYEAATVQLVGLANNNSYHQTHLGTFYLKKEGTQFVPHVRNVGLDRKEECPVEFCFSVDGFMDVRIPQWCSGEGLVIWLVRRENEEFRFSTGIHSGWQSGMSGRLANGGPEMLEIIRSLPPR